MNFKSKNFQLSAVFIFTFFFTVLMQSNSLAQLFENTENINNGITVSSPHLEFNVTPGNTQTHKIKISNATNESQKLNFVYHDFEVTKEGNSNFLMAGTSENSLNGLITVTPESIEMEPNSVAQIELTVSTPQKPESNEAAWGVIMVENAEGIIVDEANTSPELTERPPTFAVGVWIYQNPNEYEDANVDITNLIFEKKSKNNTLFLKVKNYGDGVSFGNAYVELTNLTTGEQSKLDGSQFTILPGNRRTFVFDLDKKLPKGSYSAVGKVGYDTEEVLVATELEFKVD